MRLRRSTLTPRDDRTQSPPNIYQLCKFLRYRILPDSPLEEDHNASLIDLNAGQ